MPILMVRRLRFRKVNELVEGHTAVLTGVVRI